MNLVTGATGIVGAHILVQLTFEKKNVIALKRKSSDIDLVKNIFSHYNNPYFEKITWIDCNITDLVDLENVFEHPISQIYHAAAVVSFEKKHKQQLFATNVEGTANIVNIALEKGIKKIGFISSVASLGKEGNKTIYNEDNKWNHDYPNSDYATSKYLSELEVWRAHQEGLDIVIINPGVIIGPGDMEKSSAAIFGKINNGLRFYTKGVNGFVDARDVASSIIQLVESSISGERYVCVGENLRFNDLFEKVAKSLQVEKPSIYASPAITSIAWRIAKIGSIFTGKMPVLTKETAVTSHMTREYDNSKLSKTLSFKFRTIEEACENTGRFFISKKSID